MTDRETTQQRQMYIENIYKYWLSLIPWNIPVLRPYEAETRAARPFEIGGRLYPETKFFRQLESETKNLLGRAARDMAEATDQPAILAALYETRRKYADIFRYWEKREALEPDTITEADRRPLTLGDMEAANRKARERVEFIKNCERSGVEVEIRPGAALEKSVMGIAAAWIADNIEYLESMGVQPRRAGTVEVKQADTTEPQQIAYPPKVYALVYMIDKAATGEKVPGEHEMMRDIARNYPQFIRKADNTRYSPNTIYKAKNKMAKKAVTPALCVETVGEDWRQVIVSLSKHPDKVKEYIENEAFIK